MLKPTLRLIILGNAADLDAAQRGQHVADLYIAGERGVQPPRKFPAEVDVPASDLATFAGDCESTPGRVVSFFVQQGRLFLATGGPPTAVWKAVEVEPGLKRLVRESPLPELVRACAGDFYSPELRTVYTLETRDGRLLLRYSRGASELRAINRDTWVAGYHATLHSRVPPSATITLNRRLRSD